MLSVANIYIGGYRSLGTAEIPLSSLSILIGRNNSGKSNVLRAIRLLLEGTPRDLSAEDFHTDSSARVDTLELRAEFQGVTPYLVLSAEQHRPKLDKCVVDGRLVVRRTATRDPIGLGKLEVWQPEKGEFGNPTGIDAALKQILPEVIYIEAFTDPTEEAQAKSTATLGKLLRQITQSVSEQVSSEVQEALAKAAPKFNLVEKDGETVDQRADDIKRVEQRIRDRFREVVDTSDVRIKFSLPEAPDILASVSVDLHERGLWTRVDAKGQGFQRAFYLALLQALTDELRTPRPNEVVRPFILLFEEPEAFLHPSLQREMGKALDTIAKANQVVIATHSPAIVSPSRIADVRILRQSQKEGMDSCETRCHVPDLAVIPDAGDRQLAALLRLGPSSDFLFADNVVVVEGPSDKTLLMASWRLMRDNQPPGATSSSLAIVDGGSKHVVPTWLRYLAALGFIATGVVDLDFLWDGAGKCLGGDPELAHLVDEFWRHADNQGLTERKDGQRHIGRTSKGAAFSILTTKLATEVDSLRDRLKTEHSIWVLGKGEIEQYYGLTDSSKGNYSQASQRVLAHEIELDQEIVEMILWAASKGMA